VTLRGDDGSCFTGVLGDARGDGVDSRYVCNRGWGARRAAGAGGVGIILEWKLAAIDPNERGLGDSVTGDGQPDCFIEGIPGINDRGVLGGD